MELIKRSFTHGKVIVLLIALMTLPSHFATGMESIKPVNPTDVDFTMTIRDSFFSNLFPDETSTLALSENDTLLESSFYHTKEDLPAPLPIQKAQTPAQEPDAGMNGTPVLNRYIEMGLEEISVDMTDPYTGKTTIRTFTLNLDVDSGIITEILKDGTTVDNGTFSKLPLPERTSNIYDYLIVMDIQEQNLRQEPTIIIGLHDKRYDSLVRLLMMKVGRYGIALPEFYNLGFGFLFEPLYEDEFFQNSSTASYLYAIISLILDFTLPFEEENIIRSMAVNAWLDTFMEIPNFEERFKDAFSQCLWDQYRSLAIVTGGHEAQLDKIVDILRLSPDQEAIFREHRMLVIQDSVADFEDGDINNIHKWIANYPTNILYRSGIITPDTWIADDPNEDVLDDSGTDAVHNTTSVYAAKTSFITGSYMHISFEKDSENFYCVQKFILDHEIGHWVDLGNWTFGRGYSGTRPQLLNQTGIRSQLYETASDQETLIQGMPVSTDDNGNPIPITDTEGNTFIYNSEINYRENNAEEWAWGIMADTDRRLYELISSAALERKYASLRIYMTLLSILAVNSPIIDDEDTDEIVYQVPIYRGTDIVSSVLDLQIHSDNTVIGYLPVHMDHEYNIKKIEAPNPDTGIYFPHPEITFEYAPFNPDYPENNMFRISSMSLSYDGTYFPEYAGAVITIYNPLVEDKPSIISYP